MEQIGVRELRQHASKWLARVAAGESFEITDRGRPIASLTPIVDSAWDRLIAGGAVRKASGRLADVDPAHQPTDGPRLSDILAADRDDSR
ncbi:MAG: prevent-host-death protein [Jatrophihabitantaceae bacterium]|nr:prevent-host-death protein [Jatrophihabitantaceae bacterium]